MPTKDWGPIKNTHQAAPSHAVPNQTDRLPAQNRCEQTHILKVKLPLSTITANWLGVTVDDHLNFWSYARQAIEKTRSAVHELLTLKYYVMALSTEQANKVYIKYI